MDPSTDGRTDRQGETNIPPQLHCAGGIISHMKDCDILSSNVTEDNKVDGQKDN